MKTYQAKAEEMKREWLLVNFDGVTLGRGASKVASILRGKHKPTFTPHVDTGDFVIVLNAEKVKVTGQKETDKIYYNHTGWVGHLKTSTVAEMRNKKPEELIRRAVRGMLPKGPLGRKMLKKLKVYAGTEHPHKAQQPKEINLD